MSIKTKKIKIVASGAYLPKKVSSNDLEVQVKPAHQGMKTT